MVKRLRKNKQLSPGTTKFKNIVKIYSCRRTNLNITVSITVTIDKKKKELKKLVLYLVMLITKIQV